LELSRDASVARGVKVAAGLAVIAAVAGATEHQLAAATPGTFGWTVSKHPFALTFTAHGRMLTGEAPSGGAAGQRLGYVLHDGSDHVVTDLVSSSPVPNGTRYVVATDETGRRATVVITRRTSEGGLDVRYTLTPALGVDSVAESFSA